MEELAMAAASEGPRLRTRRLRLPAPTVRLHLTVLYGTLFLCCGTALLAITYLLADHATSGSFTYTYAYSGPNGSGIITCGASTMLGSAHTGSRAVLRGLIGTSRVGQCQILGAQQHASDMHHLLAYSGVALAITALLAVVLGWLVAGRALRPLRSMTTATRRISEQNLHERLALPGPDDEVKALADTIDDLLGRLETAFEAQRRFVANASHELRTPLTMMRTAVDVAAGKPGPQPPQVSQLAVKVRNGLDKAERLVDSFLVLARAQRGLEPETLVVPLGDVAATALDERAAAITGMQLTIERDLGDADVCGTQVLLARMADNLIDNAIRYNQEGGWIRVGASAAGSMASLVVENGGPVLDEREVRELAAPFRRLGADRTGTGTGLGLSIVAAIAEAHHGTLELHARAAGGLRAVVTLPATGTRKTLAGAAR
jgi:signal transduction histidine kinase